MRILPLLFATVLGLGSLQAGPAAKYVYLISCDGMRPDAVLFLGEEGAPNLHRLMREGAWTGNARTDFDYSVTLPNHTCMITGRGVAGEEGHGWRSNGTPKLGEMLHRNKKAYLRSVFGVAHDHGLRTAMFSSKVKFKLYDLSYNERSGKADEVGEDNGKDKIDVFEFEEDTDVLVEKFLAANQADPFHFAMFHFRDPDTQGHAHGWDLIPGSEYLKAVQKVDAHIGKILDHVEVDQRLMGNTALIVTADHGGRLKTKTHIKADEPLNYTIPFFVWGPGVDAGVDLYSINAGSRTDPGSGRPDYSDGAPVPVRNGDAGNLATMLLGLPPIEGSTINPAQDLKVSAQ